MLIQLEPGLSGQFRSNPSDPRSNQSHDNLVSSKLQYLDVSSAQNSLYKHPLSKSLSVFEQDQKPAQNKILKIYSSDQYLLGGHGNQVELLYHGANLMILNKMMRMSEKCQKKMSEKMSEKISKCSRFAHAKKCQQIL